MTFEEYKKLAENPPFSDAPAIFKVEVYVIAPYGSKKYYRKTMSQPWKYSEIYCMTFEEAKQCLHNEMDRIEFEKYCEMDRIGFEKYCAYIFQIPINKSTNFPYDRTWLYDHNGNLIDQSYCSYNINEEYNHFPFILNKYERKNDCPYNMTCPLRQAHCPYNINEEHFPFRGRPENAIRFKRGDIVELLNDHCDKSKFAIVYSTPPDIKTAYLINNRMKEYGSWLDLTDDTYLLVNEALLFNEGIAGVVRGNPLRLIKPRFEPPRNVVRYLNQCLQKAIKQEKEIPF